MEDAEAALYTGQVFVGQRRSFLIGDKFADGGFAGVFLGMDQSSGDEVAVKILAFSDRRSHAEIEFRGEIAMLDLLSSCSNVISPIDSGVHMQELQAPGGSATFSVSVPFMALDRADGSFADLLAHRHKVDWLDRLRLFRHLVKGVHQMHLQRCVHRDTKAENGLVFAAEPQARLTDLGRSKDTNQHPRFAPIAYEAGKGDVRFAPPELLWLLGRDDAACHCQVDLYLVGSLLYETATATALTMAALIDPWGIMNYTQSMSPTEREYDYQQRIPELRDHYQLTYEVFASELPRVIASEGVVLLRQLTDPDPSRREPTTPFQRLPIRWDLQWLLRRIDILTKRLAAAQRAGVARKRGRGKVGVQE